MSEINPGIGLVINFDQSGNVSSAMYSENIVISEKVVDTKLYDMSGNLRMYFTTTSKEVIHHQVPYINGRSWWTDTGDCVSKAAQPFDNGVLNLAWDTAATYVTGGWYPVVLVAACAIKEY